MSQPTSSIVARRSDRVSSRSHKLAVAGIGILSVILGVLVGIFNPLLSRSVSAEGTYIDALFGIMLGVATAIFVVVQGALLYSIIVFRQQPGDDTDGPPIRGHLGLEVLWTAVPAALVTAVTIYSYVVLVLIERPDPNALIVEVTARQYSWEFYYPAIDVTSNELHVPRGRQVLLRLRSADVIHAFWVPEFRIKKDIMPDRLTETYFTAEETGEYPIVCAELCGAGHTVMRSRVVVEEPADFEAWWSGAKGALEVDKSDPMAYGRVLFEQFGCDACHVLVDAGAAGTIGPGLDGIGSRAGHLAPDVLADEYIRAAIIKPNEHIAEGYPPNVMPQDYEQRMSDEELEVMVQYLLGQQ